MSYVTSLVLHVSCAEDGFDAEDDHADGNRIHAINIWLRERGFGPLKEMGNDTGGNKHTQIYLFCAGYNFFSCDEFLAYFKDMKFDFPEQVVLAMTVEADSTIVYRPEG